MSLNSIHATSVLTVILLALYQQQLRLAAVFNEDILCGGIE